MEAGGSGSKRGSNADAVRVLHMGTARFMARVEDGGQEQEDNEFSIMAFRLISILIDIHSD